MHAQVSEFLFGARSGTLLSQVFLPANSLVQNRYSKPARTRTRPIDKASSPSIADACADGRV